ncbi:MAG: hypothetical protein ACJ8GW_11510 [Massilia sp.]
MLAQPLPASSVELSGMFDVRAQVDNGERSWTQSGLGKTRFGGDSGSLRLGQGVLAAETELTNAVSGYVVLNASDDRRHLVDLQESWLGWNPVPHGPWKWRAKAGIFFPTLNQEIDYDRLNWTPTRTVSASAINSWVGEELKAKGLELSVTHRGRDSGSPHDMGVTLAAFNGNDPAGSFLAWRGWGVGDRITGASEGIELADLPVYRPDGAINKQAREIHLFRELDQRVGYYVGLNYSYGGVVDLAALHYDNRGDPLVVKHGQYSWATKFDHIGVRVRAASGWEWMAQYMAGSTAMGQRAVVLDYRAWYALASHRVGPGLMTVRYDRFLNRDRDQTPLDPNGERGQSVALAYVLGLSSTVSLVSEVLVVKSTRDARILIGEAPHQASNSITSSLRWQF